ncbi:hypothetical protein [Acetivibrio saccincola]
MNGTSMATPHVTGKMILKQ